MKEKSQAFRLALSTAKPNVTTKRPRPASGIAPSARAAFFNNWLLHLLTGSVPAATLEAFLRPRVRSVPAYFPLSRRLSQVCAWRRCKGPALTLQTRGSVRIDQRLSEVPAWSGGPAAVGAHVWRWRDARLPRGRHAMRVADALRSRWRGLSGQTRSRRLHTPNMSGATERQRGFPACSQAP
jgi:hypothetical protein